MTILPKSSKLNKDSTPFQRSVSRVPIAMSMMIESIVNMTQFTRVEPSVPEDVGTNL